MMTHTVRSLHRYVVIAVSALFLIGYTPAVFAQSYVLDVPSTGTIRGVDTPYLIGRANIPQHYIGTKCSVSATATNDTSIHAESDLRIASGGSSFVLRDVERQTGATSHASQDIQLGNTVTVHIISLDKLGYSADVSVRIDCPEAPSPAPLPVEPNPETETPDKRTPEVPSHETPSTEVNLPGATEELPRSGPGSLAGLFLVTSFGGSLLYRRIHK